MTGCLLFVLCEDMEICGTLKGTNIVDYEIVGCGPRQKNLPRAKSVGYLGCAGLQRRGHLVAQGGFPTTRPLRPAYVRP